MVRVKICGITNATDAKMAARLGADVIGLNLYDGPRRIPLEQAAAIAAVLPPFVSTVALVGRDDAGRAGEICRAGRFGGVQLYGYDDPADEAAWRDAAAGLRDVLLVKPVRVWDETDVERIPRFKADVYLLDAHVEGQEGGTGQTFDWELAQTAGRHGPIMLAGGLTPDNVAQAVRRVRPFAVDCSSGVEAERGKKDKAKVAAFIQNAKQALLDSA